ncbi:MAG: radical SAM family heme chaperone HemW [Chloroflexi bacterium]|nr:radical SAM family heme chaperone HemW [Chloroflexota bacterium]
MDTAKVGVYVHIPFCVRKCLYCDFNSYAGRDGLREAYVGALCAEMALVAEEASRAGVTLEACSLYFGGGTPSLLSTSQMERILFASQRHLGWNPDLETTIEANPGTIDGPKARETRSLGISRISLGFQSMDDVMLRRLGRIHSVKEALEAYEACRGGGFENINIDLMYALPGQSLGHWETTLSGVIELAPEHFSLYPLTIEDGTPFERLLSRGKLTLPSDDEAAEMYECAAAVLDDAGYRQYEISNWSVEGARCLHNLVYWRNRPYLGFGAGAHSFWRGKRFSNTMRPESYIRRLERGEGAMEFQEEIGLDLEMKETAILGLRLVEGIAHSEFSQRFSRRLDDVFGREVARLVADGLVQNGHERLALTVRGRLLANEAFVAFLCADDCAV